MCNGWVELLMKEFFRQGDIEKEQGLTVSPLCDREITDIDASEVAFIKFICDPWFELLTTLIPGKVPRTDSKVIIFSFEKFKERKRYCVWRGSLEQSS